MSMKIVEQTPFDYSRVLMFESRLKLNQQDRDELHLILKDLQEHLFSQIDHVMDIAIAQGLEKHIGDLHATT